MTTPVGEPHYFIRRSWRDLAEGCLPRRARRDAQFAGSGRRNDGPAQRVTRAKALLMWTRDAARAVGWDGVGTLAPGSHADLIVVDRDPLECALEALPGTQVLRTVLGGRAVWDAGALGRSHEDT
jgi:predicted amidohydrolase YtcJ